MSRVAPLLLLVPFALLAGCDRDRVNANRTNAPAPAARTGGEPSEFGASGGAAAPDPLQRPALPPGEKVPSGSIRPGTPVRFEMRNVDLRLDEQVVFHVVQLAGEVVPRRPDVVPSFNDQRSFVMEVGSGVMEANDRAMAGLLNRYVFGYPESEMKNLSVFIRPNGIVQRGTMKKGSVGAPFEMVAAVSVTPEGEIRLHPTKIKTAGISVGGLMNLLRLQMDKVMRLHGEPGVRLDGNDLLMRPDLVLPMPEVRGRLTGLTLGEGVLAMQFGNGAVPALGSPHVVAENFIRLRGGSMRFGKLTMADVDMEMVDADPKDPLDFNPTRFFDQLVAGYSRIYGNGGQVTFVPDWNDAQAGARVPDPPIMMAARRPR